MHSVYFRCSSSMDLGAMRSYCYIVALYTMVTCMTGSPSEWVGGFRPFLTWHFQCWCFKLVGFFYVQIVWHLLRSFHGLLSLCDILHRYYIIYYVICFRRQLLEQSSITRHMCTVARDIPAASQDISLPPVISRLDSLTFLLPHFGPCDNFVI